MAILYQVRTDGSQVERWELTSKPFVLGRGECSDALVKTTPCRRPISSSPGKARVFFSSTFISTNGTWVKGARVSAHKLCPKDVILAGGSLFFFSDVPTSTFLLPGILTPPVTVAGTRPGVRTD